MCDLWSKRNKVIHSLKTPKWSSEVTYTDALHEFSPPPSSLRSITHKKRIYDGEKLSISTEYDDQIARMLSECYPALRWYLPSKRKI